MMSYFFFFEGLPSSMNIALPANSSGIENSHQSFLAPGSFIFMKYGDMVSLLSPSEFVVI